VERLRCRYEINRRVGKGERLRARHRVFDALVRSGAPDLLFAWIGGDDVRKMFGQSDCGLPVAAATVDGGAVLARQCRQMGEERLWIKRATGGVEGRAIGEMILELQRRLRWRRAGASTPDSGCDSAL
jgi:hypothetical protein